MPGPITAVTGPERSDPASLSAAADDCVSFLASSSKPLIMVGPKLRAAGAEFAAVRLAEAIGCADVVMPAANSFFSEEHPQFAGIYWGAISTHGANALVVWAGRHPLPGHGVHRL